MFLYNLFAPWQETFTDAGDGDGEGGDHLGQLYYNILFSKVGKSKCAKTKQQPILKYVHIHRK